MGKYLDKTGLQYFYNKLKDKFADKSTIETKLDSLTGAFTWKGELSALPTDLSSYSAGNVIKVGTKEYVCTETNGTKAWDELGDEGSYLLKTAAESTYLKRTAGEVKTDNLADNVVTSDKLNKLILTKDTTTIPLTWWNTLKGSNGSKNEFVYYKYSDGTLLPLVSCSDFTTVDGSDNSLDAIDLIFSLVKASDTIDNAALLFADVAFYKDTEGNIGIETKYDDRTFLLDAINATSYGYEPYFSGDNIIDESIIKEKLSTDVQTSLGKADTALQSIADKSITKAKLDDSVQTSLGKADNSLQMNTATGDSTGKITVAKSEITFSTKNNYTKYAADGFHIGDNASEPLYITRGDSTSIKVGTNSGSAIRISNVDTPTSDTDAANKGYVDEKTNLPTISINTYSGNKSKLLSALKMYGGDKPFNISFSDEIPDDYAIYGGIGFIDNYVTDNEEDEYNYATMWGYAANTAADENSIFFTINTLGTLTFYPGIVELNRDKVNKTTLEISLQAITIYTDNTAAHKAANLANIKAYEDNLKNLGVDVKINHPVLVNVSNGANWKGYLFGGTSNNRYDGVITVDDQPKVCVVDKDGTFVWLSIIISNEEKLTTISKNPVTAINEVNTLAKSKASTAVATQSANGLMSAADKKKLDGALAAISNNASVNAIDIVSYDETTNTYSGNAIEITGNIKSEIDITKHTYLTAGSTVDGHIESLDTALKNASSNISAATNAANTAAKDAAAVQSALNTFKNRTEGFATAAQGTAASTALQTISASSDEYINATVEKKEGTSQVINVTASVATDITDASDTGEYLADAYAVKTYVDDNTEPVVMDFSSSTDFSSESANIIDFTNNDVFNKALKTKRLIVKFPTLANDKATTNKMSQLIGNTCEYLVSNVGAGESYSSIVFIRSGFNPGMTKAILSVATFTNTGTTSTFVLQPIRVKDLS